MIPPEPDPPGPTPTYNDWEYLSTDTLFGYTVYVDVGSASDAFVGVVTVGLNATEGIPSGWYSDGSLIKIGDKYYPLDRTNQMYYDYDNSTPRLMKYNVISGWEPYVFNPGVFDQVPADFINILKSGNFTLVQG